MSRLVQASAGLPPQLASIKPIGTCSCFRMERPKKYATAEKLRAESGLQIDQRDVFGFLNGKSDASWPTRSRRI